VTPEVNEVRVRLDAAMSRLDALMREKQLLESQISSSRADVAGCLTSLGLTQYTACDLNAYFRREAARHSCDYGRLVGENPSEYKMLMAKGILRLTEPKDEATLVVERPKRKEATPQ